jgi:CRP/FNR family cyclic AMP-dependent transcriptional regulator
MGGSRPFFSFACRLPWRPSTGHTPSVMSVDVRQVLRDSYLLSGLLEAHVDSVSALASVKTFAGGDQVVRQFSEGTDVMVVVDGKANVNSFTGEKIAEVGPGSVLGEMSLVDEKPRSATVISAGGTTVVSIPRKALVQLMEEQPAIGYRVMGNVSRILTARLRAANVALEFAGDKG